MRPTGGRSVLAWFLDVAGCFRWSFQADLPRTATVVPNADIAGPTAATLEVAAATDAAMAALDVLVLPSQATV
jgi:hypothetical protein